MLCGACENEPCTCQRQLMVATDWIDQPCSGLGCTTVVRSRVGKQAMGAPLCKWCAGTADSPTCPNTARTDLLTREEFGLTLYEAIFLRAQAQTARKDAERLRSIGKVARASKTDAIVKHLEAKLDQLFDTGEIKPADIRRILAIGDGRKVVQGSPQE